MNGIQRFGIFVMVMTWIAFSSDAWAGLGQKSAGTYLAIGDSAWILQISQDGNLRHIFSKQFSGGVLHLPFSNSWGSWKETGEREMTAKMVNLTFKSGTREFMGVAGATWVIKFDEEFLTANVTYKGAIFPPGVNPFDRNARPLAESAFERTVVFHRIR